MKHRENKTLNKIKIQLSDVWGNVEEAQIHITGIAEGEEGLIYVCMYVCIIYKYIYLLLIA